MKINTEVDTCGLERFSTHLPYWICFKGKICKLIKECKSVM